MAEKVGKMLICDRCGKTVFLECTGEGETDGGYTRWNKFEAAPDGWSYHLDIGRLCPDCNALYEDLIKSFISKKDISITETCKTATSGYVQSDNLKTPDWFTGGDRGEIFG